MKDHRLVLPTFLGLLLVAGGCVAPSPPPPAAAAAAQTSAQAGNQTIVAIAPPATPQQTLPQWLGINDLFTGLGGLAQAKHQLFGALFPQLTTAMAGLEPPPALKSLTDPANLGPDAPPGVKDIAGVKKDEDAAPQKIAAIKYAAGIGCVKGHPGIERAFLQFLDDPTEAVRYEAARGLAQMTGTPCKTCPAGSCCTPKIYKKLSDIVTKEKSPGCYVEYSDRVRRMARLAMHNCGAPPKLPERAPAKIEGPGKMPLPKKEKIEGPVPPPAPGITGKSGKKDESSTVAKTKANSKSAVVQTGHQDATGMKSAAAEPAGPPALLVQWERVSVPFAKFSSHKEAFAAISYLRARVLGARQLQSPGFRKEQVSVQTFDGTDLATVSPTVLARTLKSLPIGQVSPVLQDREGYHLVRVLQRQLRNGSPVQNAAARRQPAVRQPSTGIIQTGRRQPAVQKPSRGIIQTRGVGRAFPGDIDPSRDTNEKWPPDFSGDQLQPIRTARPKSVPNVPVQPVPNVTRRPSVNENEVRPPLPKPDPERAFPSESVREKPVSVKPASAKPVSAKPVSAKPVSAKPISGKPVTTIPQREKPAVNASTLQIIDTRTTKSTSAKKPANAIATPAADPTSQNDAFGGFEPFPADRGKVKQTSATKQPQRSAAFPEKTVHPLANDSRDNVHGFDPFPADRQPKTGTTQPRPAQSQIATPSENGGIFGDELRQRQPAVTPAGNWATKRPEPVGRIRLPKAEDAIPDLTPVPVQTPRSNPKPAVRQHRPDAAKSEPMRHGTWTEAVPNRTVRSRRDDFDTPVRPTATLPIEPQPRTVPNPDRDTPVRRTTPRTIDLEPTRTVEPPKSIPPKSLPKAAAVQPAVQTTEQPARSEEPPRRRGNVFIQSGRRTAVREIAIAPPSASNARSDQSANPPSNPFDRVDRQKRADARRRGDNSIHYLPANKVRHFGSPRSPFDNVDAKQKNAVDAKQKNANDARSGQGDSEASGMYRPASRSTRSERKQEPIFFSRTPKRETEPEADRN